MTTGLFITIEGPEGSGKTTQARLLHAYLASRGEEALWTLEPGGTQTGKQIREILLHGGGEVAPVTELMLFEAARAQHVRELLVPSLERGRVILCDRYADSTLAYQGYGRGLDRAMIEHLDRLATAGLVPDATLLLDIDPVVGMARRLEQGKGKVRIDENGRAISSEDESELADADRIEREAIDFHRRVREGFLEIAHGDPERVTVIDASRSEEQVQADIRRVVDHLLATAAQTEPGRRERLARVRWAV